MCSTVESLDLEDNYREKKEHQWPGLDDSIGDTFSAAITGYINIGITAEYNFTLTANGNAHIYFDSSMTPLIDINSKSSQARSVTESITLSPGRHLMRLYYANNSGRGILKLTYNSRVAGLP